MLYLLKHACVNDVTLFKSCVILIRLQVFNLGALLDVYLYL